MPIDGPLSNRVKTLRQQRGWSQEVLAHKAGISRAAVSAIEIERLVPSVATALSLAATFGCRVEDLFGPAPPTENKEWAWSPPGDCRFWHARVGQRLLHFPVEPSVAVWPHDGVFRGGVWQAGNDVLPEQTLVMASCDPAAGLLAHAFARTSPFRLLVLPRSSRQALELLRLGVVHLAGVHLATPDLEQGNIDAVRTMLGSGYSLIRMARWQEGIAVGPGIAVSSVKGLLQARLRWVGREPGSGARACQDELLYDQAPPRRLARDHQGVAEAIRCGWAEAGVCVRLTSDEAGLTFISVREEDYDLCCRSETQADPRLRAFLQLIQSATLKATLADLPGYNVAPAGQVIAVA